LTADATVTVIFSDEGADPAVIKYREVPNMIPEREKNSTDSHFRLGPISMIVIDPPF